MADSNYGSYGADQYGGYYNSVPRIEYSFAAYKGLMGPDSSYSTDAGGIQSYAHENSYGAIYERNVANYGYETAEVTDYKNQSSYYEYNHITVSFQNTVYLGQYGNGVYQTGYYESFTSVTNDYDGYQSYADRTEILRSYSDGSYAEADGYHSSVTYDGEVVPGTVQNYNTSETFGGYGYHQS